MLKNCFTKKKRDELFKDDEILRRFLWKLIFFFSLAKNESNQVARLNNQNFARFSRNEIQLKRGNRISRGENNDDICG